MVAKDILYDQEGRNELRSGVQTLAKAVKSTLGPQGRNVCISEEFGSPTITKDGVQVAEEIDLTGRFRNMGAQLVKESASKAADTAGDGTTTATVLAEAIFLEGMKALAAGHDAMSLRRGLNHALREVRTYLEEQATPIEGQDDIQQVATVASNNDEELGSMIAEAMDEVGTDGVITIEEGKSLETTLEFVEGMRFDRGYLSLYFVTDQEEKVCELEDPYILLYDDSISQLDDMLPLLETIQQSGKPLLVIAENVEGQALSTLVVNNMRGVFSSAAIKAPGYGDRREEMLEDIATLTGGQVISEDLGIDLKNVTIDQLGRAKKVVSTKDETTIIEGAGSTESIESRINRIRDEINEADSDYDVEKLEKRLARLGGGVAQLNVGGATEVDVEEKKDRAQDALDATRAAIEEGVLPGGGVSLLRASEEAISFDGLTEEEKMGAKILRDALRLPVKQIAENAGQHGGLVADKILKDDHFTFGFDALNEEFTDLEEAGVIDPMKVVRNSLEKALSVASVMLTTDALVTETGSQEDDEEEEAAAQGMGAGAPGMGGMGGGMGGMGMGGGMGGMGGLGGMM